MELKEIAAISGKPGLYKILKSTPKGVIVETLDAQKKRLSIGINHRVSVLKEISIYTTTEEGTESLEQALHNIHTLYKGVLPVDKKSDEAELHTFMAEIIPEYDVDRVFYSDMKKLVSWYSILFEFIPEIFDNLLKEKEEEDTKDAAANTEEAEATTDEKAKETTTTDKTEAKPKKETSSKKDTASEEMPTAEVAEETSKKKRPRKKKTTEE